MNNLKRVLSLALSGIMLVGMMAVGAGAADFSDADEIQHTDAVNTNIFANAHKVLLIDIAVHRIADVHNRFFILQCKAKSDFDRFIDRLDAWVLLYQAVGRVHDNLLDQRGDILKMIVKGVAVDTAFLYNFPDADLV